MMLVKFKGYSIKDGFEYIQGQKSQRNMETYIQADLEAGKYGLFVDIDWDANESPWNKDHDFMVTRYGPREDKKRKFKEKYVDVKSDFLREILLAFALDVEKSAEFQEGAGVKFFEATNNLYDFFLVRAKDEETGAVKIDVIPFDYSKKTDLKFKIEKEVEEKDVEWNHDKLRSLTRITGKHT